MDKILDALNLVGLSQLALDDKVVGDGHTLTVVLDETALVDQLPHGLEVRVTPGDVNTRYFYYILIKWVLSFKNIRALKGSRLINVLY